jgi:cold-inducible RNA-binding protein
MICIAILIGSLIASVNSLRLHHFTNRAFKLSSTVDSDVPNSDVQVFIGNLPFSVDEAAISSILNEKLGPTAKSLKILRDRNTAQSRGFGYIDFENQETAEAAVSALAGLEIDGRLIKVDISGRKSEKSGTEKQMEAHSIYIGNLDYTVTQGQIEDMCNDLLGQGVIKRVRMSVDRDTGESSLHSASICLLYLLYKSLFIYVTSASFVQASLVGLVTLTLTPPKIWRELSLS